MFSLDATEDQLNFPTVFGSAKQQWMGPDWKNPTDDVSYLLDVIIDTIKPKEYPEGTLQLMITSLDYSSYTGRIAVGKITRGCLKAGDTVSLVKADSSITKSTIKELFTFEGLAKEKTKQTIYPGEICAILGVDNFDINENVFDAINK